MRTVIFGAGAIGGVVGARLHQAGHEVLLIARGAHLDAMRKDGLTLETPAERSVLRPALAPDPAAVQWKSGDVVLLATKSQDSLSALLALRDAAGAAVPIFCLQNGVENERLALRLHESVYGAVVMAPTAHLEAGRVEAYGTEFTGMIDLGRYPGGIDEHCHELAGALEDSTFISRPTPDVMRLKYAKLLLNLANAVRALRGSGPDSAELAEKARAEGRAALDAAGIEHVADEVTDLQGRWERLGVHDIDGRPRAGSSTWQSLARGAAAVETDYLNGEIVLQGRLHGVPTPVNHALCELAARVARQAGGERRAVSVSPPTCWQPSHDGPRRSPDRRLMSTSRRIAAS